MIPDDHVLQPLRHRGAADERKEDVKRASYRHGVSWIALNDDPDDLDVESVAGYISTSLVADLFDKDPLDVARDVVRYREEVGSTS